MELKFDYSYDSSQYLNTYGLLIFYFKDNGILSQRTQILSFFIKFIGEQS